MRYIGKILNNNKEDFFEPKRIGALFILLFIIEIMLFLF